MEWRLISAYLFPDNVRLNSRVLQICFLAKAIPNPQKV